MNVAYVCADFGVPLFGRKGASAHVREMVRALADGGHHVRVFVPVLHELGSGGGGEGGGGEGGGGNGVGFDGDGVDGGYDAERERFERRPAGEAGRIEIIEVPPEPRHVASLAELRRAEEMLGQPTRLRQELRNILYNLPLHASLVDALAVERPDLVYERYTLFGLAGIRAARALAVPHMLEVNAPIAEEQERMRGLELKDLARVVERRILSSTDATLVVSRRLAAFAASCGVPDERIHVVPNAVDPMRFVPGAPRDRAASDLAQRLRGRCVIGFVGSLKPWHGVEALLDAFRTLAERRPAVHLVVVGDGPQLAQLQGTARAWGLEPRVTFAGAVAHEDVPGWLSLMDIAAAPYVPHDHFYFSPLKLFEYMAMGIPVVAGRIGQIEEVLSDGVHGLLHAPGDAAELAAALERLVDDPGSRKRLGEAGRRVVFEERTWRRNAERILEIAAGLAARTEPARAGGRSRT